MTNRTQLAAAALAFALAAPLGAQSRTAPVVLRLPGSTRALAMGDAHVAVSDADAVFYNPAGLVGARGLGVALQRYGGAAALLGVSATTPVALGTIGVGVRVLDHEARCAACDDAVAPAAGALALDGDADASALEGVLGYGLTVHGLRVGAAGKLVESLLPGGRSRAGAIDLGVSAGSDRVRVALSAQNLAAGGGIEAGGREYALPRRVSLGATSSSPYALGTWFDVSAIAAVSQTRGGEITPAGGVELGFTPLEGFTFQGRLGARRPDDDGSNPVTWGLAFVGEHATVEYAWQGFAGRPDAHRVGLRWR